uniref:Putative DNA binding, helix-turn-helix domain containing protein n=1 Tax=viral metagenome TaxID=1070528 RepID=A0A6M3LD74_9ZZZZ
MKENNIRYYTVNEVAEMLNLVPNTIYRMIRRGEIKSHKFGKAVRISQAEIERLGKANAVSKGGK